MVFSWGHVKVLKKSIYAYYIRFQVAFLLIEFFLGHNSPLFNVNEFEKYLACF